MKTAFTYLILGALLLTVEAYAGGSSTVGPANPAALNCEKLGGVLEKVITPAGTDANCVIDQWKLYQEMSERNLVQDHQCNGGVGMPNPAAVNCLDINGTIRMSQTPQGQQGLCVVAQWDLFRAIDVITHP